MRLTIEDFLARGRVSADVLLESCRRLHEREQGEASVAVAYVLACEYFESFMRLMRRVDRPRRRCANVYHTNIVVRGLQT